MTARGGAAGALGAAGAPAAGPRLATGVRCRECGRYFDLLDEDDAAEWTYGHDCEVVSKNEQCDQCGRLTETLWNGDAAGWLCSYCITEPASKVIQPTEIAVEVTGEVTIELMRLDTDTDETFEAHARQALNALLIDGVTVGNIKGTHTGYDAYDQSRKLDAKGNA